MCCTACFSYNRYNIDWENGWRLNATCGSPECTTKVLASVVEGLSARLRPSGRGVTVCVDAGDPLCNWTVSDYGPCGYLDEGAVPSYVAAGATVQQMGTYPLQPPCASDSRTVA